MAKLFSKADKGLDVSMRWYAAYLIVSAGYSALVKNVNFLGELNWAEAILIGIVLALLTSASAALGMIAYRMFIPLKITAIEPDPAQSNSTKNTEATQPSVISLKEIETGIFKPLNEKMSNINNDLQLTKEDFTKLRTEVQAMGGRFVAMDNHAKALRARKLIDMLSQDRLPLPEIEGEHTPPVLLVRQSPYHASYRDLIPNYDEVLKNAKNQIESKAEYRILEGRDKERWKDGAAKQAWHIHNAQIQAISLELGKTPWGIQATNL